jgi:Axonemal dynein light chain
MNQIDPIVLLYSIQRSIIVYHPVCSTSRFLPTHCDITLHYLVLSLPVYHYLTLSAPLPLPLREWTEEGQLWVQYVSSTPATRLDVVNLQVQCCDVQCSCIVQCSYIDCCAVKWFTAMYRAELCYAVDKAVSELE